MEHLFENKVGAKPHQVWHVRVYFAVSSYNAFNIVTEGVYITAYVPTPTLL